MHILIILKLWLRYLTMTLSPNFIELKKKIRNKDTNLCADCLSRIGC